MALAGIKAKFQGLGRIKLWRLLALEFVVVLAGVLVAQLLADWFAQRKDRARAAEVRKQLVESMHDARELGEMRLLMAVCLTDRLVDVNNLGKKDAPDNHPVRFNAPPSIALGSIGLDAEARQSIRRYYGIDDLMALQQIEAASIRANALVELEEDAWILMSLFEKRQDDPDYEVPVEGEVAFRRAYRAQQQINGQLGALVSRTITMGAPSHNGTIVAMAGHNGACAPMLKYSLIDHAKAYEKGELPDGTPLSEPVREFAASYGPGLLMLRDFGWRYARRKADIPIGVYGPMPTGWKPKTEAEIKAMAKNEGKASSSPPADNDAGK